MKKILLVGLGMVLACLMSCAVLSPAVDISKEIWDEACLLGAKELVEALAITEIALHEAETHEERVRLRKERKLLSTELARVMAIATAIVLERHGLEEKPKELKIPMV